MSLSHLVRRHSDVYDFQEDSGGFDVVLFMTSGLFAVLAGFTGADIALFRKLNHELGMLCQAPPSQAIRVCRIHARLVGG
jgi:hypothetical protein